MSPNCLVIGGSHAAAQLVVSLRQMGWEHAITVVSDEHGYPYQRPPLSKDFLTGAKSGDDILIRPAAAYRTANVRFFMGAKAERIDRENQRVILDDGQSLGYTKLVLATGSYPRPLPVPGAELAGVLSLRSVEDTEKIKRCAASGKQAVIIGGGYIGLETAASLTKLGMQVTVLEAMNRVLERVTAPEISAFYERIHAEEGVHLVTGASVTCIEGDASVSRVLCADGSAYDADLVVVGIGILPATELADSAGLMVDNGILVDEYAQTSDTDILAIGDCTNNYNPIYDRRIRLESVQNAVDQAKVAAATLCGKPQAYNALPWFWSDQYDVKMQIAGLNTGYDQAVVRGDIAGSRSFAVFYLKSGEVLAVDAINKPAEFMWGKKLILAKTRVDSDKLRDESVALKALLP